MAVVLPLKTPKSQGKGQRKYLRPRSQIFALTRPSLVCKLCYDSILVLLTPMHSGGHRQDAHWSIPLRAGRSCARGRGCPAGVAREVGQSEKFLSFDALFQREDWGYTAYETAPEGVVISLLFCSHNGTSPLFFSIFLPFLTKPLI